MAWWTMNSRMLRVVLFILGSALLFSAPGISKDPPKAELVLTDAAGQLVRLSDYRGKVVVLNFWATWCGPCTEEIPLLVEAEKEYSSRGVVFIGPSLDDLTTREQITDFLARYGVKYAIWYGATGTSLAKLGLGVAVPDTAFVDQEGQMVSRVLGEIRKEEIKERLDWLLGDRTGPAPPALMKHLVR